MSVSGLDATQIQGVPVSATPPTQDQGLFYDATTGEWTPVSLTTAPGDLITGDGTGLPTLLRVGAQGTILGVIGNQPTWVGPPLAGANTGIILWWNGSTWTNGGGNGIGPGQAGQILTWNGSDWVNAPPPSTPPTTQFPLVITETSQFTFPILAAGGANEIMNNGNSIPAAYSQGTYRITGYLNINVACNVTVLSTVVDATGIRRTFVPNWQLENSGSIQTINGASMPVSTWSMIPVTLYQAPSGIGDRVILSVGATANGVVASFAIEQLTDS